jgi:hypothetical protein
MTTRKYLALISDGMAKGLFASLIVGTIILQIGELLTEHVGPNDFFQIIERIGWAAQRMMGPAIGAGVALRREAKIFTFLSAVAAGALGAGTMVFNNPEITAATGITIGNPVGALLAALAAVEVSRFVEGKTKFDLLIIPAIVILIGGAVGFGLTPYINDGLRHFGNAINNITNWQPIVMGILLAIIIGITLTLPIISSAALCIVMQIGGDGGSIAAGAALAGCCAQMVGFAVISFRDNKVGGLLAQGLGTSMLQIPNIIKNPRIWIPPTIASGVCGLLAATVFEARTTNVGAGMGTSGGVGQLQTLEVMSGVSAWLVIGVLHILIPIAVSLPIAEFMRKKGWIKEGDMSL